MFTVDISGMFIQGQATEMDMKVFWDFWKFSDFADIQKPLKYHLSVFKSYAFLQSFGGVAQKLSLPRPFQF